MLRTPRRGPTSALLLALAGIVLSIAAASPLAAGANRWTPVGPSGGAARAVAAAATQPGTAYAVVADRVYRTADAGTTWKPTTALPHGVTVNALTVDPQYAGTVYAATDLGLFRTTNGGALWSPTSLTDPTATVAIAPSDSATLYAVGSDRSFHASGDAGLTWSDVTPPIGDPRLGGIYSVAVDPQAPATVYAGAQVAYVGAFVFRSSDGGKSWGRGFL
ncbi:MAG TPA: hypothetical protein VGE98_10020, partial [Thermoanaerobaculia bacterium]